VPQLVALLERAAAEGVPVFVLFPGAGGAGGWGGGCTRAVRWPLPRHAAPGRASPTVGAADVAAAAAATLPRRAALQRGSATAEPTTHGAAAAEHDEPAPGKAAEGGAPGSSAGSPLPPEQQQPQQQPQKQPPPPQQQPPQQPQQQQPPPLLDGPVDYLLLAFDGTWREAAEMWKAAGPLLGVPPLATAVRQVQLPPPQGAGGRGGSSDVTAAAAPAAAAGEEEEEAALASTNNSSSGGGEPAFKLRTEPWEGAMTSYEAIARALVVLEAAAAGRDAAAAEAGSEQSPLGAGGEEAGPRPSGLLEVLMAPLAAATAIQAAFDPAVRARQEGRGYVARAVRRPLARLGEAAVAAAAAGGGGAAGPLQARPGRGPGPGPRG
jgi:hypothetical protein